MGLCVKYPPIHVDIPQMWVHWTSLNWTWFPPVQYCHLYFYRFFWSWSQSPITMKFCNWIFFNHAFSAVIFLLKLKRPIKFSFNYFQLLFFKIAKTFHYSPPSIGDASINYNTIGQTKYRTIITLRQCWKLNLYIGWQMHQLSSSPISIEYIFFI